MRALTEGAWQEAAARGYPEEAGVGLTVVHCGGLRLNLEEVKEDKFSVYDLEARAGAGTFATMLNGVGMC